MIDEYDCPSGLTCENLEGSYTCTVACQPGTERTSDGKSCTDIDECQTDQHSCQQVKFNSYSSGCRNLCRVNLCDLSKYCYLTVARRTAGRVPFFTYFKGYKIVQDVTSTRPLHRIPSCCYHAR